jgi:hypothetical protein
MKALSIRHPWVDLILAGTKTIEIRTWATRYRGPLLLHASSAYGISERETAARLRLPAPDPATLGAGASSAPDLEHVLPFLRPGGSKLFHGRRGWHRSGRFPADLQLLLAGAILGALVAPPSRAV